jgi:hypothetical protein
VGCLCLIWGIIKQSRTQRIKSFAFATIGYLTI